MKFKIAAGAEVDLITPGEMRDGMQAALRSWGEEWIRGRRYRKLSGVGTVNGAGNLSIGGAGDASGALGPDEGFVWSVKRLIISGLKDTDVLTLWVNEPSASTLVESGITSTTADPTRTASIRWGSNQLVLHGGERLLVTAGSMTSGLIVTITGQALEAPAAYEALL